MLLRADENCWRVAKANRASLLIDMECYFDAAKTAMQNAKRSVYLLNWAFEPQTLFHPEPGGGGPEADRIGCFLKALAERDHDLDVRVLCWKSAMPVAATQHFFPLADRKVFAGSRVKFVLDGKLPLGACHHQKMIVIDDAVGFCGGGDIGPDRWDTTAHLDDDPRREKTRRDNRCFDSRHEVMGIVDGPAAQALGELFRDRWCRATGERIDMAAESAADAWPAGVAVDFHDVTVGLSRTVGRWRNYPAVAEVEALHIAAIKAAKTCIYMESQYFTSPLIAEALAARLRQPRGPEVIIISTEHSPSYFDQATMDKTRVDFVAHLQKADGHGRFQAYSPVTTLGLPIIVHAKLTIIDDLLLRIGSANINNRSMGFDTECDLSIEPAGRTGPKTRKTIMALRTRLLAHWLGCEDEVVIDAEAGAGGLIKGLEALRTHGYGRLRPIPVAPMNALSAIVATYHLGDPVAVDDAWRPWKRRAAMAAHLKAAGLKPAAAKLTPEH